MNTSRILLIMLILLLLAPSNFAQDISKSNKLNAMIEEGMKDWQIPGLAAVVVKNGKVVFKKTYGIKDIETKEAVDDNTLFSMASTTKALIAISLGILVDQNKIAWQDKVITHFSAFKLSDPYITADARVIDLLTHNLGIGNADLLWTTNNLSTLETIDKFKYAEKTYPLRGGFIYQNIMYAVAGELIESVSGQHWSEFVENEILKPLEMTRTQTKSKDIIKAGNYTTPHFNDLEDGVVKVGYTFADQIGAAGSVWSTTNDISNYLTFLVNDGIFKGDTIIQPNTFQYLFKSHAIVADGGVYPTNKLTKPKWNTYGLGWFQQDYRGNKLDFHTGSLSGLVAIAGIMHDKDLAVYVFANLDHAELRHAIMYKAMDIYAFSDDNRDWHKEIFKLYAGFRENAKEAKKKRSEGRIMETRPSLILEQYSGTYQNEMLGVVSVSLDKGQLKIDFNNLFNYQLEHWHDDTFITNKDPIYRDKFFFNFNLNASGKIAYFEFFGEKFTKK
ncbi:MULTISPECIES: serine hydrolase [unclassified Polaribacter]|uniref:serine hydrolase n=1 Tax=unclassified Polaribacter TaxID=196858 RepID=UPI0016729F23|nr:MULTISPECIES: serine hydrolase [unclassified Polaribacter]